MFYKNFLYVTTQFFFGFSNAFSGQPLYDKVIYQLYNITFTSLPVMWYAVFDQDHKKVPDGAKGPQDDILRQIDIDLGDREITSETHPLFEELKSKDGEKFFMRDPELYQLGINHSCMSTQIII